MCGLVKGAVSHAKGDYGFEMIDLLIGFDEAEAVMQVGWYHKFPQLYTVGYYADFFVCLVFCKGSL